MHSSRQWRDQTRPQCHNTHTKKPSDLHGSWKNDRITIGVGYFLQLQDGSIDLSLQGYHKIIVSLHTELKSLVWALKFLSHHQRFCGYFVTDFQELIKMITTPEEWPVFAAEFTEFKFL